MSKIFNGSFDDDFLLSLAGMGEEDYVETVAVDTEEIVEEADGEFIVISSNDFDEVYLGAGCTDEDGYNNCGVDDYADAHVFKSKEDAEKAIANIKQWSEEAGELAQKYEIVPVTKANEAKTVYTQDEVYSMMKPFVQARDKAEETMDDDTWEKLLKGIEAIGGEELLDVFDEYYSHSYEVLHGRQNTDTENVQMFLDNLGKFIEVLQGLNESDLNELQDSLISELVELEGIITGTDASMEWDDATGRYLNGESGASYWTDLPESDIRACINIAKGIIERYGLEESVTEDEVDTDVVEMDFKEFVEELESEIGSGYTFDVQGAGIALVFIAGKEEETDPVIELHDIEANGSDEARVQVLYAKDEEATLSILATVPRNTVGIYDAMEKIQDAMQVNEGEPFELSSRERKQILSLIASDPKCNFASTDLDDEESVENSAEYISGVMGNVSFQQVLNYLKNEYMDDVEAGLQGDAMTEGQSKGFDAATEDVVVVLNKVKSGLVGNQTSDELAEKIYSDLKETYKTLDDDIQGDYGNGVDADLEFAIGVLSTLQKKWQGTPSDSSGEFDREEDDMADQVEKNNR